MTSLHSTGRHLFIIDFKLGSKCEIDRERPLVREREPPHPPYGGRDGYWEQPRELGTPHSRYACGAVVVDVVDIAVGPPSLRSRRRSLVPPRRGERRRRRRVVHPFGEPERAHAKAYHG